MGKVVEVNPGELKGVNRIRIHCRKFSRNQENIISKMNLALFLSNHFLCVNEDLLKEIHSRPWEDKTSGRKFLHGVWSQSKA